MGKNTGGMGAFAPSAAVSPAMMEQIRQSIIEPTLKGMRDEGTPYSGCLYAGLMLTSAGPRVVEFNSRLGDPETQVVLPLLRGDLARLLFLSASGDISPWHAHPLEGDECAVCVILASGGYPDQFARGKEIHGLAGFGDRRGLVVFHAGTSRVGDKTVTSGGRVLGVVAYGIGDMEQIRQRAYDGVSLVSFEGMHFRSDIAAARTVSASGVRSSERVV
jgi:phosphoribosylamine--glycine ligase